MLQNSSDWLQWHLLLAKLFYLGSEAQPGEPHWESEDRWSECGSLRQSPLNARAHSWSSSDQVASPGHHGRSLGSSPCWKPASSPRVGSWGNCLFPQLPFAPQTSCHRGPMRCKLSSDEENYFSNCLHILHRAVLFFPPFNKAILIFSWSTCDPFPLWRQYYFKSRPSLCSQP